jgi:hypothetical protein
MGAQYVILHLDEEKENMPGFGSGKWFWLSIIAHCVVAG